MTDILFVYCFTVYNFTVTITEYLAVQPKSSAPKNEGCDPGYV